MVLFYLRWNKSWNWSRPARAVEITRRISCDNASKNSKWKSNQDIYKHKEQDSRKRQGLGWASVPVSTVDGEPDGEKGTSE